MLHSECRIKGKVCVSVLNLSGMLKYFIGFWVEIKCNERNSLIRKDACLAIFLFFLYLFS